MKNTLLACLIAIVCICALPACESEQEQKAKKKQEADVDSIVKNNEKLREKALKAEQDAEANSETGKLKKALQDKGTNLCAVNAEVEQITAGIRNEAKIKYGDYTVSSEKNNFIQSRQDEEFTKLMAKYGMARNIALVISLASMRECK